MMCLDRRDRSIDRGEEETQTSLIPVSRENTTECTTNEQERISLRREEGAALHAFVSTRLRPASVSNAPTRARAKPESLMGA